jgi:hypothetical protein
VPRPGTPGQDPKEREQGQKQGRESDPRSHLLENALFLEELLSAGMQLSPWNSLTWRGVLGVRANLSLTKRRGGIRWNIEFFSGKSNGVCQRCAPQSTG